MKRAAGSFVVVVGVVVVVVVVAVVVAAAGDCRFLYETKLRSSSALRWGNFSQSRSRGGLECKYPLNLFLPHPKNLTNNVSVNVNVKK